jgi:hypothetical protein
MRGVFQTAEVARLDFQFAWRTVGARDQRDSETWRALAFHVGSRSRQAETHSGF